MTDSIDWISNSPPIAVPECGFRGEKCISEYTQKKSFCLYQNVNICMLLYKMCNVDIVADIADKYLTNPFRC